MSSSSILTSVKKGLGLAEEYDAFDPEIIIFINGVFSTLHQLGVGPATGYRIEDASDEWSTFLGPSQIFENVKTYMILRVRLLFDPPQLSFLGDSIKKQIEELEWRINAQREEEVWAIPVTVVTEEL